MVVLKKLIFMKGFHYLCSNKDLLQRDSKKNPRILLIMDLTFKAKNHTFLLGIDKILILLCITTLSTKYEILSEV
jgi:hypothetical protein